MKENVVITRYKSDHCKINKFLFFCSGIMFVNAAAALFIIIIINVLGIKEGIDLF